MFAAVGEVDALGLLASVPPRVAGGECRAMLAPAHQPDGETDATSTDTVSLIPEPHPPDPLCNGSRKRCFWPVDRLEIIMLGHIRPYTTCLRRWSGFPIRRLSISPRPIKYRTVHVDKRA